MHHSVKQVGNLVELKLSAECQAEHHQLADLHRQLEKLDAVHLYADQLDTYLTVMIPPKDALL